MAQNKWQPWKTKLESSNKSEITQFYMEKNSKFTGSFHKFLIPIFVQPLVFHRRCCKKSESFIGLVQVNHLLLQQLIQILVFVSVVVEADGLPAPTL